MTKGIKFDSDKPDYSLLPFGPLDDIVATMTYGAAKYDRDNWKYVEGHRYQAAALRHISAYMQGDIHDDETGIHHLAHACANLIFIMEQERNETQQRDNNSTEELCGDQS